MKKLIILSLVVWFLVSPVLAAVPVAAFSCTPTTQLLGSAITCTDTSTNVPTNWTWDWGDGNLTTTLQNPSYTYPFAGTFNINMSANNTGGIDWENKTRYIKITGFNETDIWMAGSYTISFTVEDIGSGAPISNATIVDGSGVAVSTSVSGKANMSEDAGVLIVYTSATGYYSATNSYVVDSDESHTIKLTKTSDTTNAINFDVYPQYVTFHLKEGFGEPVDEVNVSIRGVSTSTGNWDWLVSLLGMPLDEVPINTTTMYQTTDSLGRATFLVIPTAKYNITFTKTGYTFTPMVLVPQDTDYIIFATGTESTFYRNDGDELEMVNITVNKIYVNDTHTFLNMTYDDRSLSTVTGGGFINVTRKNTTAFGSDVIVASWPVTGCNFTNSTLIAHTTQIDGAVQANVSTTLYGYITRSFAYTFEGQPVSFLGFGKDIALFAAFAIMIFTSMLGGAAHARQMVFVMCVEGWIFNSIRWLDALAERIPGGTTAIIVALSLATFVAVLANMDIWKLKRRP